MNEIFALLDASQAESFEQRAFPNPHVHIPQP
jgi:hypothetical protein